MKLSPFEWACYLGLGAVASLLLPTVSWAQAVPSGPGPSSADASARMHFEQGVALFEEGNYDAALAELNAALTRGGGAPVLYNLGLTYQALFRYAEAVDALREYLIVAERAGKLAEERKNSVLQLIGEMDALLGKVFIEVAPSLARVWVDRKPVRLEHGKPLRLASGTHSVEVTAPGHSSDRRDVAVAGGEAIHLHINLQQLNQNVAVPRGPEMGTLTITSTESRTHLFLNQLEMGEAPVQTRVAPGQHALHIVHEDHYTKRIGVLVQPGETVRVEIKRGKLSFNPDDRSSSFLGTWWFWSLIAGAAAGSAALWLHDASKG